MLQRLPIAFTQVKASNASENLLKKMRKLFIYYIEQKKSIKKNIMIQWIKYKYNTKWILYPRIQEIDLKNCSNMLHHQIIVSTIYGEV